MDDLKVSALNTIARELHTLNGIMICITCILIIVCLAWLTTKRK